MLIESVRSRLRAHHRGLDRIEEAVLRERLPVEYAAVLGDEADRDRALLYFYLYTVPFLEAAGLLDGSAAERTLDHASAQLCLGVHLRYLDYLVDADASDLATLEVLHRAEAYLASARGWLRKQETHWGPPQDAVYIQYLWYEQEVRSGHAHTLGSLWRRVSPLCVIPETCWGGGPFRPERFPALFRAYLSWSLVLADCGDAVRDLEAGRSTPVTRTVRERLGGRGTEFAAAAAAVDELRGTLEAMMRRLLDETAGPCPGWAEIIRTVYEFSVPGAGSGT